MTAKDVRDIMPPISHEAWSVALVLGSCAARLDEIIARDAYRRGRSHV